ncbi:MAG: Tad domain-containing protein [Methylobacter tundripaludum]|nr:Tad domain-containing protein [Methylobacter tundripaludum]
MKINCSKKQRGVVVVAVTIALPVLLLIMGLALDFGHVFVNKTRLQNALDATALSAAITINKNIKNGTGPATAAGIATFDRFKAGSGNNELAGLTANDLVFEYSRTLNPWGSFSAATDKFAFVRVTSANMLNVTPVLIQVTNRFTNDIPVPAIATAGPTGQNCSLTPFVMCAMVTPSVDKNCDDDTIKIDALGNAVPGTDGINDCYGYNLGQIRSLVIACNGSNSNCPPNSLESGNFNLLDLDGSQGGKDIRDTLQGTTNVCLQGNTLNTKPGWTWGNVKKGIDARFASDTQQDPYPLPNNYSPSPYNQYETSGLGNNRRVMAVPIGDCTGLQNGNTTIPKVGIGCTFLTETAQQGPGPAKKIMVEFTGDSCPQNGVWDPNNPVLNGPYKIVLFKSPGSGDS